MVKEKSCFFGFCAIATVCTKQHTSTTIHLVFSLPLLYFFIFVSAFESLLLLGYVRTLFVKDSW